MTVCTFSEFLNTLHDKLQYFPDQEDLQGAATALMRLQDTYALQTEQLARGEIEGAQITEELSGPHLKSFDKIVWLSKFTK